MFLESYIRHSLFILISLWFADSTDLTKAIKVTGETYDEIGNIYGEQVSSYMKAIFETFITF